MTKKKHTKTESTATNAELVKEVARLNTKLAELRVTAVCVRCNENIIECLGEPRYCDEHMTCEECGGQKEDGEADCCDACDSLCVDRMVRISPPSRIP
jgi:hypothetical protein